MLCAAGRPPVVPPAPRRMVDMSVICSGCFVSLKCRFAWASDRQTGQGLSAWQCDVTRPLLLLRGTHEVAATIVIWVPQAAARRDPSHCQTVSGVHRAPPVSQIERYMRCLCGFTVDSFQDGLCVAAALNYVMSYVADSVCVAAALNSVVSCVADSVSVAAALNF